MPILYHPGTDGKLRAVVALTGAEMWSWDSGTGGALTRATLTPAGLLLSSSAGGVYLVDPDTQETVWSYRGPELLTGVTSAPMVAGRQMLFVTNAGYLHSMLSPKAPEPWPR